MSPIDRAIERLYVAFADVPRPDRIEGCPCCIGNKDIDGLLRSPLREVAPAVLAPYASSAFLTVGGLDDYLYFLPRILEVTAKEAGWWPDPEVTARAIRTAGLESWPAHRVEALREFLSASVDGAIEAGGHFDLDGWMCAIARMGLDVVPYLARIERSPAAVLAYFEENVRCLPRKLLCNAFWELPCEGHDAIVAWFYSDAIRKVPFEAYGYLMDVKSPDLAGADARAT